MMSSSNSSSISSHNDDDMRHSNNNKRPREGQEARRCTSSSSSTTASSTAAAVSSRRRDQRGYTTNVMVVHHHHHQKRRRVYGSEDEDYYDLDVARGGGGDGWECIECGTWNEYYHHDRTRRRYDDDDDNERCCYRCGRTFDDDDDDVDEKANNNNNSAEVEEEEDLDEFGRAPSRPKPPQWPPLFGQSNDTSNSSSTAASASNCSSSSYVLDARSGMFYESLSDFFYDPKSKLYFGNKTQKYYQHCPEKDPPFQEVATGADTTTTTTTNIQQDDPAVIIPSAVAVKQPHESTTKPTIAIKLTSKVLPGKKEASKQKKKLAKDKKPQAQSTSAAVVPRAAVAKKDAANIEKWTERGQEKKQAASNAVTTEAVVPKTASGQPVCLLCRRKFASLEKLQNHEKLSALHKENLEKKKKDEEAKQKEADELKAASYRDRAFERRLIHGPDSGVASTVLSTLPQDPPSSGTVAEPTRPEDSLDDSNIGNQMLQKLGWKSGGAIGRQATGEQSGKTYEASTRSGQVQQNALVRDWERIETLAGNQRSNNKGGHGAGIGH